MSTVATNEKVTMQDGQLKEYNFRVCFLDPQQGKIAGSFVYDNLGFDKAAKEAAKEADAADGGPKGGQA